MGGFRRAARSFDTASNSPSASRVSFFGMLASIGLAIRRPSPQEGGVYHPLGQSPAYAGRPAEPERREADVLDRSAHQSRVRALMKASRSLSNNSFLATQTATQ